MTRLILVSMLPLALLGCTSSSGAHAGSPDAAGQRTDGSADGAARSDAAAPDARGNRPDARADADASPSTDSCPVNDGSAAAPSGAPQLPNLLSGYTKTLRDAGCKLAGVDYAVGVPSGQSLKDWQTLSGPGITVGSGMVRVDNTNGAHFDSVDFSLHGGAMLYLSNSNDTVVTNSKFASSSGYYYIQLTSGSTGLDVEDSVFDGKAGGAKSGMITATGSIVLKYNWFENFQQHVLEAGGDFTVDYRYNLIENGALSPGAHLNFLQWGGDGSTSSRTIEFNTTYQTPQVSGGEGFQFDSFDFAGTNQNKLQQATVAYNTMIATGSPGTMSYMIHGSGTGSSNFATDQTILTGAAVMHDNYFDTTGAYGAFYPGSFVGWQISGNWDMVSGSAETNW